MFNKGSIHPNDATNDDSEVDETDPSVMIVRKIVQKKKYRQHHKFDRPKVVVAKKLKSISYAASSATSTSPVLVISIYAETDMKIDSEKLYKILLEKFIGETSPWSVWIITDGLNNAVSKMIRYALDKIKDHDNLKVIGILPEKELAYSEWLQQNHHIYIVHDPDDIYYREDFQQAIMQDYSSDVVSVLCLVFLTDDEDSVHILKKSLKDFDEKTHVVILKGLTDDNRLEDVVYEYIESKPSDELRFHIFDILQDDCLHSKLGTFIESEDDVKIFEWIEFKVKTGKIKEIKEFLEKKPEKDRTVFIANAMDAALQYEKIDVVEFLLDNGFDYTSFWSEKRLRRLFTHEKYKVVFPTLEMASEKIFVLSNYTLVVVFSHEDFQEYLLMWAIFRQNSRLINLLCKRSEDPICAALVIEGFLRKLPPRDDDPILLGTYEEFAVEMVDRAFIKNPAMTKQMLNRRVKQWGENSCLNLAFKMNLEKFLVRPACSTLRREIWNGYVPDAPWYKIILYYCFGLFFAHLIVNRSDLNQDKKDDKEKESDKKESDKKEGQQEATVQKSQSGLKGRVRLLLDYKTVKKYPWSEAVYLLYSSPMMKFYNSVIFHLVFIGIMSFFVITKLEYVTSVDELDWSEWVVWIWCLTYILQELADMIRGDDEDQGNAAIDEDAEKAYKFGNDVYTARQSQKARDKLVWMEKKKNCLFYFESNWNLYDCFLGIMFVISITLRFTVAEEEFLAARIFCTLLLCFFIFRSFQFYFAHPTMGPNVYVLLMMFKDVGFFFALFIIFALMYGTLKQSIMYGKSDFTWPTVLNIFYYPFWNLLGQIQLSDLLADNKTTAAHSCSDQTDYVCRNKDALVYVAYALFLIVTTVSLLNMLIALFGLTINKLEEKKNEIYSYHGFKLLEDYKSRLILPPPFILIYPIVLFIKYLLKKRLGQSTVQVKHEISAFVCEYEPCRNTYLENFARELFQEKREIKNLLANGIKVTLPSDQSPFIKFKLPAVKVPWPPNKRGSLTLMDHNEENPTDDDRNDLMDLSVRFVIRPRTNRDD